MDFKEYQVKMLVRDDLTVDGLNVAIEPPNFYVGQKVYVKKDGVNPVYIRQAVIAAALCEFNTQQDNHSEIIVAPRWHYLIQYPWGHIPDQRYVESKLLTEEQYKELLAKHIDDLPLFDVIKAFDTHNVPIKKTHIIAMREFLDDGNIPYNASNIKETAKVFLAEYQN